MESFFKTWEAQACDDGCHKRLVVITSSTDIIEKLISSDERMDTDTLCYFI